jgi:hypothetical protein
MRRCIAAPLLLLTVALFLCATGPAFACNLDGVASLSENGHVVSLTATTPTKATLSSWALFTLVAAAPKTPLVFQEDLNELGNSLPASALKQPFRWQFGDGSVTVGRVVTHRYAHTGWYKINVSYALRPNHWISFDSARIHIVAPGALLTTNFTYYLHEDAQTAIRFAFWLALAGGVGLFVWKRLRATPTTDALRR